jgi:hypothetical protein
VLPVSRVRDLVLLGLDEERVLVVACDSVGSIGPKPHDSFPSTAAFVAHCAVRVAMLELVSCGARPELLVDALSVEMEPTGAEMIAEIRRVAASIGLGADRVTGSTEDNVPTVATGIGITVLGTANRSELRPGSSVAGDLVVRLGAPTSAPVDTLVPDDSRMVPIATVIGVLAVDGVHDALPVGSHGTAFEVQQLAETAGLLFVPATEDPVGAKSGGPASCVLVSVRADALDEVLARLPADLPRTVLGRLDAPQ